MKKKGKEGNEGGRVDGCLVGVDRMTIAIRYQT